MNVFDKQVINEDAFELTVQSVTSVFCDLRVADLSRSENLDFKDLQGILIDGCDLLDYFESNSLVDCNDIERYWNLRR